MLNENKFANAQELLDEIGKKKNVKHIHCADGLIERAQFENERVILTEDNKQLLLG